MRGRHHRDGVAGDVDAEFQAARVDVGEMLLEEGRRLVRNVQINAVQAAFLHFEVDRPRHHVARSQLGPGVVRRHEARAVGQHQHAAFAAHGFADEERLGVRVVQAGGVELDEFHTDIHRRDYHHFSILGAVPLLALALMGAFMYYVINKSVISTKEISPSVEYIGMSQKIGYSILLFFIFLFGLLPFIILNLFNLVSI